MSSSSLRELFLTRLREFYRQPARIFWVYAFPTILAVVLGFGFTSSKPRPVRVTLIEPPLSTAGRAADHAAVSEVAEAIGSPEARAGRPGLPGLVVKTQDRAVALAELDKGRVPLVVEPLPDGRVVYHFDPTRPEANTARASVDDAIQRHHGRRDPVTVSDEQVIKKGSRYIDFLIPGLIGLNAMGGGLWGIGFLLVNMRIGKLLKRFAATPMPRRNFLLSLLGTRLTFMIPDVAVLLGLGVFLFRMPVRGNPLLLALVVVVGAMAFAGIGMLVASRAQTTETVSGLMNLVMIPMWLLSGVFFSTEDFPRPLQWISQALPLTHLVDALRRVILWGDGLAAVALPLAVLAAWAVVTFLLALKLFRWT